MGMSSARAMLLANIARKQAERALRRANRPPEQIYGGGDILRVFKLTENLDCFGAAFCNPCRWNEALNEWGVDTSVSIMMIETIGQYYGLIDELLWGRMTRKEGSPVVEARSHGAPNHEGKLDGALAADGSATFSIYTCAGGSWVDTTVNVTCYAPPRLSSGSVATGKWGRIYYDLTRPKWTLDSAEC